MRQLLIIALVVIYVVTACYLVLGTLGPGVGVRLGGRYSDVELFGPFRTICLVVFIVLTCAGLCFLIRRGAG